MKARIVEQGNGLPDAGDLCYHSSTDTVYRIIEFDGWITTNGPGEGNSIRAVVEQVGCAADISDDDWAGIESANYRVELEQH